MLAKPSARVLVVWTGQRDEPPESGGMVHALQVHQLMDHHVVSDLRGHLHETPVQTDMAVRCARSPAPLLIAYGHPGDAQLVLDRQFAQPCRQLELGSVAQLALYGWIDSSSGIRTFEGQLTPLLVDPRPLLLGESTRFSLRSASRNRDSNSAVCA